MIERSLSGGKGNLFFLLKLSICVLSTLSNDYSTKENMFFDIVNSKSSKIKRVNP